MSNWTSRWVSQSQTWELYSVQEKSDVPYGLLERSKIFPTNASGHWEGRKVLGDLGSYHQEDQTQTSEIWADAASFISRERRSHAPTIVFIG